MKYGGYVYIMTTAWNTVLYTGVTSRLFDRVREHIEKFHKGAFTAKYNVNKLVYYQWFPSIQEAIGFEKKIKGGSRKKKIALIEGFNPSWDDLFVTQLSNCEPRRKSG